MNNYGAALFHQIPSQGLCERDLPDPAILATHEIQDQYRHQAYNLAHQQQGELQHVAQQQFQFQRGMQQGASPCLTPQQQRAFDNPRLEYPSLYNPIYSSGRPMYEPVQSHRYMGDSLPVDPLPSYEAPLVRPCVEDPTVFVRSQKRSVEDQSFFKELSRSLQGAGYDLCHLKEVEEYVGKKQAINFILTRENRGPYVGGTFAVFSGILFVTLLCVLLIK